VVRGDAVEQGDETTGDADDGTTEAVVDSHLQATDVEVVKVGIEGCVALVVVSFSH